VFWVGESFNSPEQFCGTVWPVVVVYAPWTDVVQSSPPGVEDKRSAAQKSSDEAARVEAVAKNPIGGQYSTRYEQNASTGLYYASFATYVGPASGIISP
jgi:hypothetical protein